MNSVIKSASGEVSSNPKLHETPELRFIKRFSSIKDEYEAGKRASLVAAKCRASRVPNLSPIQSGQQTSEKLWDTTKNWKMNDLYEETLTGLFPSLETVDSPSSKSLVDFLQKLHRFKEPEHRACLESSRRRTARGWVLNLEIIEAKDLPPTDINGLSDPFCTLGWSTRQELSFRTVVCPETLNPVWNEFFTIPLTGSNSERENLKIKVWDQDPEERKRDKLKRIGKVKTLQGFRTFVADLKSGQAKQELIGTVTIPAKHTESEVVDKWFPLENASKQGQLRVRMALGLQKERMAALHDYKKIVQILLIHDLGNAPLIEPYSWNGTFASKSWTDYIQRQLGWAWSLKPHQVLVAQWCAYNRIHLEFPLNLCIFPAILAPILAWLENPTQSRLDEQYVEFWSAVRRLILYFETFILNIHEQLDTAEIASRMDDLLRTVSLLYDHLSKSPEGANELKITASKLVGRLEEALGNGASLHFQRLLKDHDLEEEIVVSESTTSLKRISSLGTQLQEDLNTGYTKLQAVFSKTFKLNYFATTYRVYDTEFARLVEPAVAQICRSLSQEAFQPSHIGEMVASNNEDYVQLTRHLFALFISVKQFAGLSSKLGGHVSNLRVAGVFHNWFRPAVLHWWESLRCVITPCIQNAVKLEGTNKTTEYVFCGRIQANVSYEAVSVASTLSEITVVWNSLEWPIVEESYDFVVNILKQLWAHAMYYSQLLSEKISELESNSGTKYFISKAMCIWVNNMKYIVEEGSQPVIKGIDVDGFLKTLSVMSGIQQSAAAAEQIERLHSDSKEIIIGEISGVFEKTVLRMKPEITRLFLEATEKPNKLEQVSSQLIEYMDQNFKTLRQNLSPCNFELAFEKLWEGCLNIIRNIIQYGLNNHKSTEFFLGVQSLFSLLKDFFHGDPNDSRNVKHKDETDRAVVNSNTVHDEKEIRSLLDIHSAPTSDLKCIYYQERYRLQVSPTAHGVITVKVHYSPASNELVVNVLNAKHLKSYDSDGNSDPYVEVRIVPTELYENIRRHTTGIQKSTLFPLFDETFNIALAPEQMKQGGFLHLAVYDYDFIGKNDFHGEALLPLDRIEFTAEIPKSQISLNLDKPSRAQDSILKNLERRHWDKAAVKFVKNEYSNIDLE